MSGVVILSLSAVIVKIIGLIYKIPMLRLLGSEGMGYFNSAYELYTLFCAVATTGLPVAMSVMISSSEDVDKGSRVVFKAAIKLFLWLGVIGCGIMIAFAKPFALFLGSARAADCIFAISPCVFLICVSGAYRGYFQGKGAMMPTAISQVIEALGKLILGLIFAFVAINFGFSTEKVAAFAVLGLVLGTALSALYLELNKRFGEKNKPCLTDVKAGKGITLGLLKTAIPVTLSSAVISITKVIDMSVILRRLQDVGQSSDQAFAAYGDYTTLALPLFSLAPALVSSVAMPLIPTLSRAVASGDRYEQTRVVGEAIRLTSLISMPISLGLTLFSKPILELIFSGEKQAIITASPLLSVLGISVTLSCMITVSNAVLQSYSKASAPILSMLVGSAVKVAVAYMLVGNGNIGILGAPISTFVCDMIITLVNFYFICRVMPNMPRFGWILVRPFLAAALSVSMARVLYNVMSVKVGESAVLTLLSIVFAAMLYVIVAFVFGAVGKEDISKLPFVGKYNKTEKI